jgi:hypothetical protein
MDEHTQSDEHTELDETQAEEPVQPDRRKFLGRLKKWSAAVLAGVVFGADATSESKAAWINRRGGGGWANRPGGGGWLNRRGGGGWLNRR